MGSNLGLLTDMATSFLEQMNKSAQARERKQLDKVVALSSPRDGDETSWLLFDCLLVDAE